MAVVIRPKKKGRKLDPKDMKLLKKYADMAEKMGLLVEQSNDPDVIVSISSASYRIPFEELPDFLRKTMKPMKSLRKATASDIAKLTNRRRAVESDYLNRLTLLGYVKKEKVGRFAYFTYNKNKQ
jgi:hypothetical protein